MPSLETITAVLIVNLIPTVEQLGGITTGVALGMRPLEAFLISLLVNIMLFVPVYFGANTIYKKLSKIDFLKTRFERYIEKARKKAKPYVEKYGVIGVAFFIAIPGPLTGTYTASLVSWALNLDWRKAWFAVGLGSILGGTLIFLAYEGLFAFIKL